MIENLKIGCTVSRDQLSRILNENITAGNVLDELDFSSRFIECDQGGQPMREVFADEPNAAARYNELKTWEEFDVMKGFLGSISDWAMWQRVIKNG